MAGNNEFYVVLNNLKQTKNSNWFETYIVHSLDNLKVISEADQLEVAVTCCILPNTLYNIPSDLTFSYFLPPNFTEKKVSIDAGYYSDVNAVIPIIEKQLDGKVNVKFGLNQLTNRFSLSCDNGAKCNISEEFGSFFGLKYGSSLTGKIASTGSSRILSCYSSGLKLQADFVNTISTEDGKRENFLAVLPLNNVPFGKTILYQPKHLHYFPCIKSQLNMLRFCLVYLDGTAVTSVDMISCLILHFKSNTSDVN